MSRPGKMIIVLGITTFVLAACTNPETIVTTEVLLREMTNLERLTRLPEQSYRSIQFSSYDRRSIDPSERAWFANEDGFGGEPVPGFEKVLKQPGPDGIGEYLVCDIEGPGAILRLWTAGISGKLRFYLDGMETPVYEGGAEAFFWKTIESLSGGSVSADSFPAFRQFDATYFPIPFEKRCRLEWIGNTDEIHFYHVGLRIYNDEVRVKTFDPGAMDQYLPVMTEIQYELQSALLSRSAENGITQPVDLTIPSGARSEIFRDSGSAAIRTISLRVDADSAAPLLRKSILKIYFDQATIPQVEAPLGDFFGTAPGINPYSSLPLSVHPTNMMSCYFVMPYRKEVRIEIENLSGDDLRLSGEIGTSPYSWEQGSSMHFHTRWSIDHELTAQNINDPDAMVSDIEYLDVMGTGRIVGAGTFIYNPSNVPASWGNWWGEGDEKISIDRDTFPSFFGTGSEDYYNYSWSSARIFSYPYCGQPRNDGPGNRGYVSNFRWHISDDIPFNKRANFLMELGHHGVVPGFSYGRIVYFYALPGLTESYKPVTADDVRNIRHRRWSPEAYGGSADYRFTQAEELLLPGASTKMVNGFMWAESAILQWTPEDQNERLRLQIRSDKEMNDTRLGMTLAHTPEGGILECRLNGKPVKFGNRDAIDLSTTYETILDNHFSEVVKLRKGDNIVEFELLNAGGDRSAGIDFIWLRE